MAISKTTRKLICIGNGSANTFNFPFKVLGKSNFTLILTNINGEDTTLTVDSDYSLSGIGEDSGVIVTYPLDTEVPKLATGEKLTGYRSTEITQLLDFMYGGGFSPRIHENAFDKITMILQELNEELERRPMLPITVTVSNIEDWIKNIALIDGSNINRIAFLSALGIGSDGELDLSDFSKTSGTNIDIPSYRSLLGIDDLDDLIEATGEDLTYIESATLQTSSSTEQVAEFKNLLGLDKIKPLIIQPQTIVNGAVGDIPDGWLVGDCDNPAEHLEVSTAGSATLIVKSGLQVCAGDSGSTLLSEILASDTSLDLNDKADGTHYIFADLNENGTYKEFVSDSHKPCVGQVISGEYEDELPAMTSDTTPEGYEVSSTPPARTDYPVSNTFNKEAGYGFIIDSSSGVVQVTFPERYIECYSVQAPYHSEPNRVMKSWTTEGQKPDGEWVVVDSVANQIGWVANETRFFNLAISGRYKGLRFNIASVVSGIYMEMQNIYLYSIRYPDFYNTSNHTHYDPDNNIIRRVYIGEVDIVSGTITHVISYQHGTVVTLPVNDGANISKNSTYYLDIPYLGYCTSQARIYHEDKWGKTGWVYSSGGYGVVSNFTGRSLSIQTGSISLITSSRSGDGGEFTSSISSAPAKVTVERSW